jgi:hypothetical protein
MEKLAEDCYRIFSEMLSKDDFLALFESLSKEDKKSLAKASLMQQRAVRCKTCDPDVCMALLCSAVETVSGGKSTTFKDWVLTNKLDELTNRNEKQVRDSLNKAYKNYVYNEENREGITYNFRKFLTTFCPNELKIPPVEIYRGNGDSFEITLRAIYSKFRCLFLHEGTGYPGIVNEPLIDEETGEEGFDLGTPLLTYLDDKKYVVSIKLHEITIWFEDVVRKSLLNYLKSL